MQGSNRSLTIIAKTTNACNLGCVYCYVQPEHNVQFMDLDTARNMMYKFALWNKSIGNTKVIWHGGEPMLMGLDFYRKILGIQHEIGKDLGEHRFSNSIQTNGTLMTSIALDFFQAHKFHVGTSLDGIRKTHDITRPYKTGKSSFDDVFNFISEAKKRGVSVGAICVLNRITAKYVDEIYIFCKNNAINLQINPQFPSRQSENNKIPGLHPHQLAEVLISLFDIWFFDDTMPDITIEPFQNIIYNLGLTRNKMCETNGFPLGCNFRNDCAYSFISIDYAGNVYPCGRFSGNEFSLGNINCDDVETLFLSEGHQLFLNRANNGVTACLNCKYRAICNGGCPNNAYLTNGTILSRDGYCQTYEMLFTHIENTVKTELEK